MDQDLERGARALLRARRSRRRGPGGPGGGDRGRRSSSRSAARSWPRGVRPWACGSWARGWSLSGSRTRTAPHRPRGARGNPGSRRPGAIQVMDVAPGDVRRAHHRPWAAPHERLTHIRTQPRTIGDPEAAVARSRHAILSDPPGNPPSRVTGTRTPRRSRAPICRTPPDTTQESRFAPCAQPRDSGPRCERRRRTPALCPRAPCGWAHRRSRPAPRRSTMAT